MTDDQLESIALSAIRFGEARRKATEDSSNGKLAMAFLEEGLATNLPNSTVELLEEVERLNEENSHLHSLLRRMLAAIGEIGPAHVTSEIEDAAEEIGVELGRQSKGPENS